jgi:hypothetical protein
MLAVKTLLRRTPIIVSIAYAGGYATNLFGENFTLETKRTDLILSVDLSKNLRTRHKSENTYLDALQFLRRHAEFQSLHISDKQVVDGLAKAWERAENAALFVSLELGEHGTFRYPVQPSDWLGGVLLTVKPTLVR